MDSFSALQRDPELGLLRGGFVILFRHARWYFVGSHLQGHNRTIKTIAVLSPQRAQSTLAETASAAPKKLSDLGAGFAEEVARKVLPNPEDYLPLLRTGAAAVAGGLHSDTMETTEWSQDIEAALSRSVARMMTSGTSAVCITFK